MDWQVKTKQMPAEVAHVNMLARDTHGWQAASIKSTSSSFNPWTISPIYDGGTPKPDLCL